MSDRYLLGIITWVAALLVAGLPSTYAPCADGAGRNQKPEVKVITNPKKPVPSAGQRKKLVFKEELSIGQKEGDENYMFGEDVVFNTDDEGNFYVTDWDRKRILKYKSDGKYLLTIGRQGQGPGEFQNLSVVRFDKDGNIYVTDIANRRISFFDKAGKYLRQVLIPDVFEDLYINSQGKFISSHSVSLESEGGPGWRIAYGVFDDKFKPVAEFYAQEYHYKPPAGRDATSFAKFSAEILNGIAFQPRPSYFLRKDDVIFFGFPKNYSIDIYSPDGQKLSTIQKDFDPSPVTQKDKDYFVRSLAERFLSRTGSRSEDQKKEVIKFIEYPKFKPAYSRISLMENGWLAVVVETVPGEYTLFDLFDERGRFIGHFQADFLADYWFFFKNGKAYAVIEGEGYKFVKRYAFEIQNY